MLCGQKCDRRNSVWSLVSSLRLLSVPLDPRSLLALTTLVPAFLDSSKHGPYARYCSSRWGQGTRFREASFSDRDMDHDTRQGFTSETLQYICVYHCMYSIHLSLLLWGYMRIEQRKEHGWSPSVIWHFSWFLSPWISSALALAGHSLLVGVCQGCRFRKKEVIINTMELIQWTLLHKTQGLII